MLLLDIDFTRATPVTFGGVRLIEEEYIPDFSGGVASIARTIPEVWEETFTHARKEIDTENQKMLDKTWAIIDAAHNGDEDAIKILRMWRRAGTHMPTERIAKQSRFGLPATNPFSKEEEPFCVRYKFALRCSHCGGDMVSRDMRIRHCSFTCRDAVKKNRLARNNAKRPRATRSTVGCAQCGHAFSPKRADGKYCSAKCRVTGNRQVTRVSSNFAS